MIIEDPQKTLPASLKGRREPYQESGYKGVVFLMVKQLNGFDGYRGPLPFRES
jgi:hypothetical protein